MYVQFSRGRNALQPRHCLLTVGLNNLKTNNSAISHYEAVAGRVLGRHRVPIWTAFLLLAGPVRQTG